MAKVAVEPDKRTWHPSVLPGQIVLVSTVDEDGEANIAPKSWVSMAALGGPIVAFGCTEEHRTLRNIEATGEFVVNVVTEALAERAWAMIRYHGAERLRHSGLTFVPAQRVRPPLVEECPAHLECELDDIKRYGAEAFVFGRIVAASIEHYLLVGAPPEQYFRLRPVFYLEGGTYGSIDTAKRIRAETPTEQPLFLIEIGAHADGPPVAEHLAFLRRLRDEGRLLAAGPYERNCDGPTGMYLVEAATSEEAEAFACEDPLVQGGAAFTVRRWTRTF